MWSLCFPTVWSTIRVAPTRQRPACGSRASSTLSFRGWAWRTVWPRHRNGHECKQNFHATPPTGWDWRPVHNPMSNYVVPWHLWNVHKHSRVVWDNTIATYPLFAGKRTFKVQSANEMSLSRISSGIYSCSQRREFKSAAMKSHLNPLLVGIIMRFLSRVLQDKAVLWKSICTVFWKSLSFKVNSGQKALCVFVCILKIVHLYFVPVSRLLFCIVFYRLESLL